MHVHKELAPVIFTPQFGVVVSFHLQRFTAAGSRGLIIAARIVLLYREFWIDDIRIFALLLFLGFRGRAVFIARSGGLLCLADAELR